MVLLTARQLQFYEALNLYTKLLLEINVLFSFAPLQRLSCRIFPTILIK